jgi:N-acetylneuraminic acid mutarotase
MGLLDRVTGGLVGLAATAAIAAAALAQVPTVGGAWETLAPMPDRRTEVSAVSDGERLYVLGGFAPANGATTAPLAVHVFDPATGAWSMLTSLPVGVNHAGLAFVDGALYVVGGYRETTFQATNRVMIYDVAADQWRDGRQLPTARGALAVAVVDGRIHAIGGSGARGAGTAHEIYDPRQDLWVEAPTCRRHASTSPPLPSAATSSSSAEETAPRRR